MIDQNLKEEFLKIYRAYADVKNETKEMNAGVKDLIKVFAKKMEVKPAIISKAFAYRYKKAETGEDDIWDIQQVMQEIEND
jgi:hypothetical protein